MELPPVQPRPRFESNRSWQPALLSVVARVSLHRVVYQDVTAFSTKCCWKNCQKKEPPAGGSRWPTKPGDGFRGRISTSEVSQVAPCGVCQEVGGNFQQTEAIDCLPHGPA